MNTILEHIHLWTTAQTPKTSGRGNRADNQQLLGIQKLRELILELAVRGKLVPQDPLDEPASVLLKRIEAEKKRLTKEGKIKKQEVLSEVGEDEKPFELPEGWEWTRLNSITHLITDGTHYTPTYISDGVPFLSVKDMSSGIIDFSDCRFISQEQHDEFAKRCNPQKGDLLLTKVGTTGIPVLIEIDRQFSIFVSVALIKFPHNLISGRFLSMLIKSPLVKTQSEEGTEGIGNKNLVLRKIVAFKIVIPPLAEQHRIVAKVDDLMALCDQLEQQQTENNQLHQTLVETLLANLTQAGSPAEQEEAWQRIANHFNTLFTTEASIDQLKQTILQLAVMGKLVPQSPEDEPASELLKKIAKEKARLVKEGKIKKQAPLPEITDDEKPFELPEGWEWVRLQKIVSQLGDGLHGTPEYTPNTKYYFINGNNLKNGKIEIKQDTKTVSSEEMLKYKKELTLNSVLVSINGTLGNVAFYNGEEIMLGKSACYFNLSDNILKFHIKLILESPYFLDYAIKNATGTTIRNLGLKAINEFAIPLPPLAEQHRIVAKVDELFALCDALKERMAQAQTTQNLLAEEVVQNVLAQKETLQNPTKKEYPYELNGQLDIAAEPGY